ncbi:hypothetical protein L1281_002518 [Neisseria sp. HSC-16F19]|nr:hypothetical protein [Neisseria sp. HSC-16F19]MCP2041900.1 hypothetical protein [Neisseria sp. HSC-16F19]
MKTIITGMVALAMIGSVAALAPTMDAADPHLQPTPAQERMAAQDAAARQAEDTLREIVEGMTDYEIMRGVVYEPSGD